jgi:hypothetical protein
VRSATADGFLVGNELQKQEASSTGHKRKSTRNKGNRAQRSQIEQFKQQQATE